MKKRFLTLCLATTLALTTVQGSVMIYASEQNSETGSALIEFENVVLVDDETVTIELVNFYSEDVNWSEGPQNEKYVTFKVTNKTDHDILLNPDKFYLNNEECYVSMVQGSVVPDPGRAGNYSFCVAYNTTPQHTALSSLDELFMLEGSFSGLNVYEDSKMNSSLEVAFAMPADLSAVQAAGADATVEEESSVSETTEPASEEMKETAGVPVETWAEFNDNQKSLYYAAGEIEEEITGVFEYLGNMTMADGSRQVADLLFIQAPEAEDGVYVYDIATGELYDHINHKKVAEQFETMEHCINTLANCYEHYAAGEAIMWMDSEIILPMTEEEIQEVLAVLE